MATTGHAKWTGGLSDGPGSVDTGNGAISRAPAGPEITLDAKLAG